MTVKIRPGRSFEVEDGVRHLLVEFVEGGALLVQVRVEDCEAAVAIEPREARQLSTFLA
jgi:hypothetical protein